MKNAFFLVAIIFLFLVTKALGQQQPSSNVSIISRKSSATMIVFLAIDCPISQKYIAELNGIASQYAPSVLSVMGFIPGRISRKKLSDFVKEYNIHFKIYRDKNYQIVRELKTSVTPEVYLFDNKGFLKYHGAIDNWFYELGSYRQTITEHYLTDAIEAVLKGNEPAIKETDAVGCVVQVKSKKQDEK